MKNIILLMTDTYRWDNLFDRAAMPVRTPCLDRFAEERATSIERFVTGSFPTIPHRTDVATGHLGWPHYGWGPIEANSPNHAAAILGEAGYVSQLICDCPHLFNARFQHAFSAAFQHRGQEGDRHLLHMNDPIRETMPLEKTRRGPTFAGRPLVDLHRWTNRYMAVEEETFPARTGRTAVRWLEENSRGGPFFLWVDFFDPHEPWDAPEYLVRRYDPEYDGTPMLHPNYGPADAYTPEELRNLRAHYCAEAELVDRHLGRILQKIDDLRLWDDTVVAVTSDHGMSLGEHNRTGKCNIHPDDGRYWPLYPEISRVPFLLAGADVPRGQRLDLIGQPIDILPTLSELAGAEVTPPRPFTGRSFAEAVRTGSASHRDYAVTGTFAKTTDGALPPRIATPFVTTPRWGYAPVGADGGQELFDLEADPLAETNVAEDNEATVAELHGMLLDHLREHDAPDELLAGCARSH